MIMECAVPKLLLTFVNTSKLRKVSSTKDKCQSGALLVVRVGFEESHKEHPCCVGDGPINATHTYDLTDWSTVTPELKDRPIDFSI